MQQVDDQQLRTDIGVVNDYDPLRSVVMCLGHTALDAALLARRQAAEDVLRRKVATNRFEPYDLGRVREQQMGVAEMLAAHGVNVLWAEPIEGCTVQQYTRDIGFVIGDHFYAARSQREERQRETMGLRPILAGDPRVVYLEAGRIEGGDVIPEERFILVGLGEETSTLGVESLRWALEQRGESRPIKLLEFTGEGVIHADTKITVIAPGIAIIDPTAFTAATLSFIREHYDTIEATPDEVLDVQVNTLVLGPDRLAMSATAHRLAEAVSTKGIEPVLIDVDEITKLPGSLRCITLPLHRERLNAR